MKTMRESHEIADEMREMARNKRLFNGENIALKLGIDVSDYGNLDEFDEDAWDALIKLVEPYGYYADMSYFLLPRPKEPLIEVCETEPSPGRLAIKVNPIEDAINRWRETLEDEVCQMLFETFCRETCRWELVNRGAIYDIYGCSRCGYEHVENKCDAGATELDPEFCPNCGAKVVNDA